MRLVVCTAFVLACILRTSDAQELRVASYVTGLVQPVGLVADPSEPRRQFVIEKPGRIRVVDRGALVPDAALDVSAFVATAGEQGLLGLAIDPAFATTGRIWINFTRHPDGATVIARYTRAPGEPLRFDPASRLDLEFSTQPGRRVISQPASNHNGGKLLFGADGHLYIAMGDGGGGNDVHRTAQDPQQLLGKILRLDVRVPDVASATAGERADAERGYRVPPDNPFVDGIPVAARPEIWAFGLRNPWRVTLDDPALGGSGALLIADVGQGAREEIDYQPAGEGGHNYGWPLREGTLTNTGAPVGVAAAYLPLTDPVHEYPRSEGISVTGGHVYRGRLLGDAFVGRYVYGDLVNRLRSLRLAPGEPGGPLGERPLPSAGDVREHTDELGGLSGSLVSIDTDAQGELYLVMLAGAILRLTTTGDADRDGIDDAWAITFGLQGLAPDARGPFGDPDGDGRINAQEFREGTHPLAGPVAYFGEGANGFFATRLDILNEQDVDLPLAVRFVRADGKATSTSATVPARRSLAIDTTTVPGLAGAEFATVMEATRPVPALRTMTWPAVGEPYGSHAERAIAAPATRWYFAEGATTQFELFFLLGNPSPHDTARVRIDYLRQDGPAVSRTYDVAPASRRTIWVNQEPGLDRAELGAIIVSENAVPVLAERAMYTRGGAAMFAAGHAAAGEPAPATRWTFAEGSTGDYFDTFLSVINPGDSDLAVEAQVRLQDGSTRGGPLRFTRVVPARTRRTLWLDREISDEGVPLDRHDGISVELTSGEAFVAERAMWWPGTSSTWQESHVAAGFSEAPAASWRIAGGEYLADPAGGSDPRVETYVLIANVGVSPEDVGVTVYLEDREPLQHLVQVPAQSRVSVPLSTLVAGTGAGTASVAHTGVLVQARSRAAQLYAEQATYGSTAQVRWARGAVARGTR